MDTIANQFESQGGTIVLRRTYPLGSEKELLLVIVEAISASDDEEQLKNGTPESAVMGYR